MALTMKRTSRIYSLFELSLYHGFVLVIYA